MASGSGDARSLRVESYVRGYHVYQRIWNPFVGEVAVAVREEGNVNAAARLHARKTSSSASHSYLLLEIFHNGANGGIMRHIE